MYAWVQDGALYAHLRHPPDHIWPCIQCRPNIWPSKDMPELREAFRCANFLSLVVSITLQILATDPAALCLMRTAVIPGVSTIADSCLSLRATVLHDHPQ